MASFRLTISPFLSKVKEPGDVVIMHRLKVDPFRGTLQGSGCVSAGFRAIVFPGSLDAELKPRDTPLMCTYTEADLEVVRALKLWYHSSDCPVEKERLSNDSTSTTGREIAGPSIYPEQHAQNGQQRPDSSTSPPPPPPNMTRLHASPLNTFFNIEGQVIGIYPYDDAVNDLVIYLWDGVPPHCCTTSTNSTAGTHGPLPFFRHTDSDIRPPDRQSRVDPALVALTGHRVLPACCAAAVAAATSTTSSSSSDGCDWSVPVFLFDEHAARCPAVRDLRPGDLVRLINVRCGRKRASDGCLLRKLTLNGGGEKYGRCIQLMRPESDIANGLLSRLQAGRTLRPALGVPTNPFATLLLPQTIGQLARLPEDFSNMTSPLGAVESQSFLQAEGPPGLSDAQPRWLDCSSSFSPNRLENTVHLRVCARVISVHPRSVDEVSDCLFLVCHKCRSAFRLSSLSDDESFTCDCSFDQSSSDGERIADLPTTSEECIASTKRTRTSVYLHDPPPPPPPPPRYSVLPAFRLLLRDPTGELVVSVFADSLIALLGEDVVSGTRLKQLPLLWQTDYEGWLRESQHLLSAWLRLVGGWIDGLISIAWRRQYFMGTVPISRLPDVLTDVHLVDCRRLSPALTNK